MCRHVYDADSGAVISGIGELADAIGGIERVVYRARGAGESDDHYEEYLRLVQEDARNNCLCPVDVAWTLLGAGMVVRLEESFDITFSRRIALTPSGMDGEK